MTEPVNVICIKYGKLYAADYVNILHRSVRRHLHRPFIFHCCTDDAAGLDPEVRVIGFPENPGLKTHWPHVLVKLMITRDGFGGLRGPTLFLDLDVAILGDIGPFFDFQPGRNCIIHNWVNWRKQVMGSRPRVGNSSVFRFEAGPESDYIYQTFLSEMGRAEDTSVFNTEQAFLTHAMQEVVWWPDPWVRSFKWHLRPVFPLNLIMPPRPPHDCRILVFHGRPDPDEAIRGYRGKTCRHSTLPALWIANHWKL
jgi:hypothetical protein